MVASEATAESTRIMLVDPQTSTVIDEVEESGSLRIYPWQRTSFIELMRANGNGQVRRLLRIDGQKIMIGSAYNNLQYVSATMKLAVLPVLALGRWKGNRSPIWGEP